MYRIFTRTLFSILLSLTGIFSISAQSYYSNGSDTLALGVELRDTIEVTGLTQNILNSTFGLDSVTLNLNCLHPGKLIISLISPDGTEMSLAETKGGWAPNYTGTNFNMNATYLVEEFTSPFTGEMRPSGCLNNFNNGQNGNGLWQLRVIEPGDSVFSRVVNFGLHFNDSPETPYFYSSKLPIVVVNTKNVPNSSYWPAGYKVKVNATMGIIYNGPGQDNHLTDPFNHFEGNIKLMVRGATSADNPQRPYGIDIKGADQESDSSVSLLGMPAEEDWILYNPWNDKSLVRNIVAYHFWGATGRYSPRTRLVEVVVNNDYRGVYVLMENIKRDNGRLALAKLDEDDTTGTDVTGGYIIKINQELHTDSFSYPCSVMPCTASDDTVWISYEYPRTENIRLQQKAYIRRYTDSCEQALAYGDPNDTITGYRHFMDVPSFIDYAIMTELSNNFDAYRNSTFMYKPKNGKLFAGPLWDMNAAYGNCYADFSWSPYTFRWDHPCPSSYPYPIPFWWNKFKEDETFMHELRCRYSELRTGVLSFAHISQMMDSLREMLEVPQQRHYERWPILGRYIPPAMYTGLSWDDDISYLQNWMTDRINNLDLVWYDADCALGAANLQAKVAHVVSYPNPAGEYLHVEATQKSSGLAVYNEVGQLVYESTQAALKYDIDVRQWSAGVYVVEVKCEGGTVREKVTVL